MCGITGITGSEKQLLGRMMGAISHRGPDQHGMLVDDAVSLGHQRLSIIDVSEKGKQPIHNEKKDIWIIFNGEIYNYQWLKNKLEAKGHRFYTETDTEVMVHAYEEYGASCVKYFNGDFAFCIYDQKNASLFLARDRLGIKPLYYAEHNGQFMFSSEIKSLLENKDFERKVNKKALDQFMAYRHTFGRETMFDNIFRVLPGECLQYNLKTKELGKWIFWDVNTSSENISSRSDEQLVAEFRQLFEDSVRLRLRSDVPLGAFLSGGLDSSSIVAMMSTIKKQGEWKEPIKTFSVGFGYEETDETKFARQISDTFGTEHKEFIVPASTSKIMPKIAWHCDEPLADPALIPVYILSEQAKKDVTVILTGDGGDEVFCGYEQEKFLQKLSPLKYVPKPFRVSAGAVFRNLPSSMFTKVFKYSKAMGSEGMKRAGNVIANIENLDKSYKEIVSICSASERSAILTNTQQDSVLISQKNAPFLNKLLYHELKTLLPENMLMKTDRMTMAHAIEGRVPFLDHRLVEFSYSLPSHLKLNGTTEKYIIRKAMGDLLPKQNLERKKQRFYVPIDKWIKEDLLPQIEPMLSKSAIEQQGLFKHDAIKKMLDKFSTSQLFYARQLWSVLSFQMWYKQFIEVQK